MKKRLFIPLSIAIISSGCGSPSNSEPITINTTALYHTYENIEELAEASTDVILAKVVDKRVEEINIWLPPETELEESGDNTDESYHIFTIYTFEVLDNFLGNTEIGELVEVKQMGGTLNEVEHIHAENVDISIDDELVMFLYFFDDENMPASFVNPIQSVYHYLGENEDFESAREDNNLVLTNEKLELISE